MTVNNNVYVIGVGMIRFAKLPGRTIKSMTGESVEDALNELGEDEYTEEDIRLVRIKFISELGN